MAVEELGVSIKSLWEKYNGKRSAVLTRARDASEITIPSILPKDGHDESATLDTPFNSIGASGVNNLASKLLIALFPPNQPFFKLQMDEAILQAFEAEDRTITEQTGESQEGIGIRAQTTKRLTDIENIIKNALEGEALRTKIFLTLKHLIVTGNSLIRYDEDGMRVFSLNDYVIKRDPVGNTMLLITRENLSIEKLPEDLQVEVKLKRRIEDEGISVEQIEEEAELLTIVRRMDNDMFEIRQEVDEIEYEGGYGTFKEEELPYIALRWTAIDGEDYGRGHVEEYIGDLRSLTGISKAIISFAQAVSKIVFLVNPNGNTEIAELATSSTGDIIEGTEADVSTLQVDKFYDFRVAKDTADELRASLSTAFMMNTSVQRDAERVTATEISFLAGELEDRLGGVYSILAQELQTPILKLLMKKLEKTKDIPKFEEDELQPVITTGLEALGRGNDYNNLMMAITSIKDIPEAFAKINVDELLHRIFVSKGVSTEGLLIPKAVLVQQQQEQAQAQQQALAQEQAQGAVAGAIPQVASEVTKGVVNGQVDPQQLQDMAQQFQGQ